MHQPIYQFLLRFIHRFKYFNIEYLMSNKYSQSTQLISIDTRILMIHLQYQYFIIQQNLTLFIDQISNKLIISLLSYTISAKTMTSKLTIAKTLSYLGAAISAGQPIRGTQTAPSLIRNSGLFTSLKKNHNIDVIDYGDIKLQDYQKTLYPPVPFAVKDLHILGPLLGRIHHQADSILKNKPEDLLLTVGGDHSVGAATISAVRRTYSDLRVVWIDAHPDCTNSHIRNPSNLYSENYHGMPLSHLTGITTTPELPYWSWLQSQPLLDPKNVVLLGIRDIDPDEHLSLKKFGVKCFTMDHIDKYGIGEVMTQTMHYLDPKNQHPFHISFDIDGVDPDIAGQTGTRFRYGLSGRESIHIVRRLAHERRVVSMDLVEINQSLNPEEQLRAVYRGEAELKRVTKTVGLGIDLVNSLFTRYFEL